MSAIRLHTKSVEKPWGRTDLPAIFPHPEGKKIGEIWFDGPEDRHPPVLVKYIFTSERLSIQVHPNDAEARARGLPGGKSECWYILDAEPGATLGIGTTRPLDGEELRAAALDGSIEGLMDWKPVEPGTFYYIPAGTVHAIGGGVTLVEVQLNNDVTYRLYDYGRPRELHLDDGVAVARPEPYRTAARIVPLNSDAILLEKDAAPFSLAMATWEAGRSFALPSGAAWFIPVTGEGVIEDQPYAGGQCWLTENAPNVSISQPTCAFIAKI